MDKTLILKLAAIGVVLFFIFEMFALGYLGRGGSQQTAASSASLSGTSELDVTLKSYEPYLLSSGLTEGQIARLKGTEGVEDVLLTENGQVVSLKTSKYVKLVYKMLQEENATVAAVANVVLPNTITMRLENGSEEDIAAGAVVIKLTTDPFASEGETLRVKMNVRAEDGVLVGYSPPSLVPVQVTLNSTALVVENIFNAYSFSIPWEKRNEINTSELNSKYGSENVSYAKHDYVSLKKPLTAPEIMSKKYGYISVIDENSITPVENFTDKEKIIADFGDVSFPDSTLGIRTKAEVALPFQKTIRHVYSLNVSDAEYSFNDPLVLLGLEKQLAPGDKINVSITGVALGKKIFNLLDVREGG